MKIFYTLLLVGLFTGIGYAQNSIRANNYMSDMQYYNPANVSIDSVLTTKTALSIKKKSVTNDDEIWNKRLSVMLSHAGRIGETNSYYTVSYVNDDYSFFNRNALYLGYTQQLNLTESSQLSIGARVVANMDIINWDKLQLPHNEDGRSLRFNPDLDLGIDYRFKKFNAGIGVKNITENSFKLEGVALIQNRREINVNLSYQQGFTNNFSITPFVLLMHERNTIADAGLYFSIFKRYHISYALRINELRSIVALNIEQNKYFSFGVAFDRSDLVSDIHWDFVVRYSR